MNNPHNTSASRAREWIDSILSIMQLCFQIFVGTMIECNGTYFFHFGRSFFFFFPKCFVDIMKWISPFTFHLIDMMYICGGPSNNQFCITVSVPVIISHHIPLDIYHFWKFQPPIFVKKQPLLDAFIVTLYEINENVSF